MFSRSVVALGEAAFIGTDDNSVPDGLYWRVTPGGSADLPSGPILLRHLDVAAAAVDAVDAATGAAPDGQTRVTPDAPVLLLPQSFPGAIICWAHLQIEGDVRVAAISGRVAVGGACVELSARTHEPYTVAGHDMAGVLVSGDGRIIESAFFALPTEFSGDTGDIPFGPHVHAPPEDVIPGRGYAFPGEPASWKDRVALSAPRAKVPYAHLDPHGPWDAEAELNRVEHLCRTDRSVAEWLHIAYNAVVSGERGILTGTTRAAGDPYRVVAVQTGATALTVGALDPGVGRWLGRSGMLPHGVVDAQGFSLLVATVPLHVYSGSLPIGVTVVHDSSDESLYDNRIGADGGYLNLVDEVRNWPPHPEFGPPDLLLAHIPMPYTVGVTPARPVQPVLEVAPVHAAAPGGAAPWWAPDRPRRWEQSITIGSRPVSAYALHGPIPRGPVAFVRSAPTQQSLHPVLEGTDLAAPMVPGWSAVGASVLTGAEEVAEETEATPVTWSVTLSDWIGRWGEPGVLSPVEPPEPPPPAPPTIEAGLDRSVLPAGSASTSPGDVHVLFRVPPATLPGALRPHSIIWSVNGGDPRSLDLVSAATDPGEAAILVPTRFPAPPTTPGEHATVLIKAHLVDSRGTSSESVSSIVDVSDGRPLRPPTVSPHLLLTSRRSGDPHVSITVTVRAPGGLSDGAYRFYVASESALRTAAGIPNPGGVTRAARAQQIGGVTGAAARRASMPALPAPVPVDSGLASARLEIPAGTVDVLAVRAVPVTAEVNGQGRIVRDGVEAPFATVRPAFVVVPLDDVPPTPELELVPTAAASGSESTRVRARITVRGVPANVLDHYAQEPLQARVVEASTEGDPWFWPEIATVALQQSGDDPSLFTAEVGVDVPAWSCAGLAVAVRYPPEDMVIPGADVVLAPELTATGVQGSRIESPWGPVSVPAWVQVTGNEPGVFSAPDGLGGVRVTTFGLPELASGAATFRMKIHSGLGGAMQEVADVAVTPQTPEVFVTSGMIGTPGARVFAVLQTPFGEYLTPVDVTP